MAEFCLGNIDVFGFVCENTSDFFKKNPSISCLNSIKDPQLGLIIYRLRSFLILEDFASLACCILYSHGERIAQKLYLV